MLGAGAMLGYQFTGRGEEKTGGRKMQSRPKVRKPTPPPTPPGTVPNPPRGAKANAKPKATPPPAGAAAGGATASPAPGDLSRHLNDIYSMTGSQWMSRGPKRLGALASYMGQNHPIASAGIAGLGGLAGLYGARKLYRGFLGGNSEENRPKITIGM